MAFVHSPARRFRVGALLIAVVSVSAAHGQDARTEQFETYLEARAALGQFNGSALVAEGGEVLFDGAFGFANMELGVPNGVETRYRAASITKQFTAMAVMMLQEDGLLGVDDPISKYLGDLPDSWSGITIHQVLRHTSGIPDYEEWFGGYASDAYADYMSQRDAPDRIVEEAKQKSLDFEPGSEFRYSNTGYVLLGFLIEAVSQKEYEGFLKERIFDPLGMVHSSMDRSERIVPNRAEGYKLAPRALEGPYFNGMTTADFRNANEQFMSPPQGDAGLVTTTGDLYLWDRALASNALVSGQSMKAIFTAGLGGYGYGWEIEQTNHGTKYGHTGGLPGFASQIVRFPDDDAVIIVLSNVQTLPGWIVRDLTAILFGEPYALPSGRHVVAYDSTLHGGHEGRYVSDAGDTLGVFVDDIPVVKWDGHFTAGLFPETPGRFYAALIEGEAIFDRLQNGSRRLIIKDRFGAVLVRAERIRP